ncbi:MAG TPA: Gfo/Idh/MocA family oxidoreductase, partial [Thermoguttaceae bacterium]|nr:Gfo/Idh/MocA family oxidoreductase [Thermoguttaceae bacterium]
MTEQLLGVAIHGAGWVAGAHGRSWLKQPRVRIVSISDMDRQRAERLAHQLGLTCAVRESLEEVLADPAVQVVDICTPSHLHAQHGIQAAQAGRHILVEKPIALNLQELRSLRQAVQQAGVKSLASFVLRWNPMVETIHRLVHSGAIGRIFYAEADYWHNIPSNHHAWQLHSKRATAGSAMLLAGCHALDIVRWLLADQAEEVSAVGNNPTGRFEYPPNVIAWIRFRGGAVAKVSALLDCQMPYTFQVELAGAEGTIRENRIWSTRLFPGQTGWSTVPTVLPDSADVSHHPFDAEIAHFVQCILEDRESHC